MISSKHGRLTALITILLSVLLYWTAIPVEPNEDTVIVGIFPGHRLVHQQLKSYLDKFSDNDSIKGEVLSEIGRAHV